MKIPLCPVKMQQWRLNKPLFALLTAKARIHTSKHGGTADAPLYEGDEFGEFDKDQIVEDPFYRVALFLSEVKGIPSRPHSCLSYAINILLGFKYFKRSHDIYGCLDY